MLEELPEDFIEITSNVDAGPKQVPVFGYRSKLKKPLVFVKVDCDLVDQFEHYASCLLELSFGKYGEVLIDKKYFDYKDFQQRRRKIPFGWCILFPNKKFCSNQFFNSKFYFSDNDGLNFTKKNIYQKNIYQKNINQNI